MENEEKKPEMPQGRLTKEQAEALEKSIAAGVDKWRSLQVNDMNLKTEKNADGTFTNTLKLDFGNSFLNLLRMYVLQLLNSGTLPPERRDELLYNASIIERLLAEIKVYQKRQKIGGKTNVSLDLTPADLKVNEDPAAHAEWLKEVTAALESPSIKSIISFLLMKTEGGGGKPALPPALPQDQILYSTAAVEQQFNTHKGRQKKQQRLPMEIAGHWQTLGGITVNKDIEEYGMKLTEWENTAFKAVLSAFTQTDYKGNTDRLPLEEVLPKMKENPQGVRDALKATKGVKTLPQIRITQADFLRLCGADPEKQSERQYALEALKSLGSEQRVFIWQRWKTKEVETEILSRTGRSVRKKKSRELVRDESGEGLREDVYETGTLLRVKEVRDPQTQLLQYYEIAPSLVLLEHKIGGDSRNFISYPSKLERQVRELTGKRLKKYEALLLLWLAWKFEEERQHRASLKKHGNETALQKAGGEIPTEIGIDWEALAAELTMPESLYKKKRKNASNMLEMAYDIAVKAGFLKKYERDGTGIDRLYFNPAAYHLPERHKKMLDEGEEPKTAE